MNSSILHQSPATAHASEVYEVQVTQLWGNNPIAQKTATNGGVSFPMGAEDVEIARWSEAGELVVAPPPGAVVFVDALMQLPESFVLRPGHVADVTVGSFNFRITVGEREERPSRGVAAAVLEDAGVRTFAGSGIAHAALLAAVAFFMPSLSQADDDTYDRRQLLDLKAYIDNASERDRETKPADQAQNGESSPQSNASGGQAAKDESGGMGANRPVETAGRWSVKGNEKPENVQLARERALKEAAEFGMVGLLLSQPVATGPVVSWGNLELGSDPSSHLGGLYSGDPGEAFGTGLGLSGTGIGGGGPGEGLGLNDVGGLGRTLDGRLGHCAVNESCGFGHSSGRLAPTHVARSPKIDWSGTVTTNGRLDPSVIQRIVRLNSGRFIGCYREALQTNPSLSGRVAVSFIIGRDGTVTTANDTTGSDLADSNVRSCVVRGFKTLEFPEPVGGIVTVTYPFSFSPE